jgi:hypothetical protein
VTRCQDLTDEQVPLAQVVPFLIIQPNKGSSFAFLFFSFLFLWHSLHSTAAQEHQQARCTDRTVVFCDSRSAAVREEKEIRGSGAFMIGAALAYARRTGYRRRNPELASYDLLCCARPGRCPCGRTWPKASTSLGGLDEHPTPQPALDRPGPIAGCQGILFLATAAKCGPITPKADPEVRPLRIRALRVRALSPHFASSLFFYPKSSQTRDTTHHQPSRPS